MTTLLMNWKASETQQMRLMTPNLNSDGFVWRLEAEMKRIEWNSWIECVKKGYHKCKACQKPFISMKMCQIWRHFARVYDKVKPDFWRKIMWSDECSFDMSRGITRWVICTKGKCYHSACCESVFKSNSTFIPTWGAISYNWKSSLMFLKEHEKQRKITMKD